MVRPASVAAYSNNKRWAISRSFAASQAFGNRWFIIELGQFIRSNDHLDHWFDLRAWISLK